mgnify:CR=1 FL=1
MCLGWKLGQEGSLSSDTKTDVPAEGPSYDSNYEWSLQTQGRYNQGKTKGKMKVYAGLGWVYEGKNETKLKHIKKTRQASENHTAQVWHGRAHRHG